MKTVNKSLKLSGGLKSEDIFGKIICLDNLFLAWKEFSKGKRKKKDVCEFEKNLKENILDLHDELNSKTYKHSDYVSFYISDLKLRKIYKACVKDRVLHHAAFRVLYPTFDKCFIFDSYSCRNQKGTHRAVKRLNKFINKESKGNSRSCYILKCDVRKFFDSINQDILLNLVSKKIEDDDVIWLINKIIESFPKGLPLGNITSQLFANIYLNELDKFVKFNLKIKCYVRYCDDFVMVNESKRYLLEIILKIDNFLKNNLKLLLHPGKIIIKNSNQGIDFLGYVILPGYTTLRTKTRRRIFKAIKKSRMEYNGGRISGKSFNQKLQSYLGMLKHCRGHKIKEEIIK